MKRLILFAFLSVFSFNISAQKVAIGSWDAHLSYNNAVSVAVAGNKVYCASSNGLFAYFPEDNSVERYSKVTGLSDVEIKAVKFNEANGKLLIAYENSNIDILEGEEIYNLSDIKRKNMLGNNTINSIHFVNQYAYLACGFGIVVLDMEKREVKDTYYIGPSGSSINVMDITSDDTRFYAATELGVYTALMNSANLADFNSWNPMPGLPDGMYNSITTVANKIVTNYSAFLKDGSINKDSLFVYDGIGWSNSLGNGFVVNALESGANYLLVIFDTAVVVYDSTLVKQNSYTNYFDGTVRANYAYMDLVNNLWIADKGYGLVSINSSGSSSYRYPNGPSSANVKSMSLVDGHLWVAPGGGNGIYYTDGIYTYSENEWQHVYGNFPGVVLFDSISNITNVVIDPSNSSHLFAVWSDGLIEFENNNPVKMYNQDNSTLQELTIPNFNPVSLFGLAFDADNNLWIGNNGVEKSISVRTPDNEWKAFDFSAFIGKGKTLEQILVDENDQKWVILFREGILLYAGGKDDTPDASNSKRLTTATGSGALPSLNVLCMAEDNDGQIWIGTDEGIAVFYNPATMFSNQSFDAQQILIEQDGNIQLLLETESIQSIAVDGANRKWIATADGGVFLMSEDGTEEIYHFTESNSPLLSDNVYSIAIDHKTGDVFFGTDKGIISYRGTAIGGLDAFSDVYAFPNPVKPGYTGTIAIKGLMTNSTVKITDINGNLVYETISEGGQAIWNGKSFSGERASSGVYMVFCTSEDGMSKLATKILFIN